MPRSSMQRRVVITGMGLISPLGNSKEALWTALTTGKSGVVSPSDTPHDSLAAPYAAEAREFTGAIEDFGPLSGDVKKAIRKGLKVMCRESQMGVAAAQRALEDAGLAAGQMDPERSGVVFGSDYMVSEPADFLESVKACLDDDRFQFSRWAERGLAKMSPLWLLKYLPNMPASHIAIYNDLRGPNNTLTQREAAANLAIGEALRVIARDHADVMLAGATGTRIHSMKAVQALLQEEIAGRDRSPAEACRPFDLHRDGMVLGEGAGVVVLEELSRAVSRGATIYAEVSGAASSSVVDRAFVANRHAALSNAIRGALQDAGASAASVGHIQAHGLSTRSGDREEARALNDVFGDSIRRLPVTAAKSYFGNLGAGSGAVELIAGALALGAGQLFPVLNYETPDADCPVYAVRDAGVPAGDSFLNLSVTPQGQASCVHVRRYMAA